MIHLYTMTWNEEAMLAYFFRHYDHCVDRYVIYDDGSTDRTLEMARAHPRVEIRRFERVVPDSFVASAQILQNMMWKESRGAADWVIVTAIDELLHHPSGLRAYLDKARTGGVTLVPALGYEMVARRFPPPDAELTVVTTGVPERNFSKLSIFDPSAIAETNYKPGRHDAEPRGRLKFPARDEVVLLHYKNIDPAYLVQRQHFLSRGLGSRDRAHSWGEHYDYEEKRILAEFRDLESHAIDLADPAHAPSRDHRLERWWRQPWIVRKARRIGRGLAAARRRAQLNTK